MDASFTQEGKRYALSFERNLRHSPGKVWRALTERELLKQWFPCDIKGKWEVGAKLEFVFLHGEGDGLSDEELSGEVLTVDRPSRLEFRWGTNYYRYEISAQAGGCKLVFTDRFDDPSTGARNAAGWEICLENLDLVLEGAAVAKFMMDVWKQKFAGYARKFEKSAGPQKGLPEDYPTED